MQRQKTKEEISEQEYLNVTDIKKLLGISWNNAKRVFLKCDELDDQLDFRVDDYRIRIETLEQVTHKKLKNHTKKGILAS